MPRYVFRCPKCQHEFSEIVPMKDFDGKKLACPKCQNKGVERVFVGSFSVKKGSGSCSTGTCPLVRK